MNTADFDLFAQLLREKSGLLLTVDKVYLLETRLLPVAHKHGFSDLAGLAHALRIRQSAFIDEVVDAMTTNETLFFRDKKPFDTLQQQLLPQLAAKRQASKKIRIWSAACSTGQEPYSLAMTAAELLSRMPGFSFEIFATDISSKALKKAEEGVYNQFEVQRGLPVQMLLKYFDRSDDNWIIKPALRQMVSFRPFNLLHDGSQFGRFDIIFCRNVLIYFDMVTKTRVVERLTTRLAPDGYLSLGCAESLLGVHTRLKPVKGLNGIYADAGIAVADAETPSSAHPSSAPGKTLAPRMLSR